MTARRLLLIESAWHTDDVVDDLTIRIDPDSDHLFLCRADSEDNIVIDLADIPAIIELVNDYRPRAEGSRAQVGSGSPLGAGAPGVTTPQNRVPNGSPKTSHAAPGPIGLPATGPADEAAIIARLRELAVDGIMPSRAYWDSYRGDLPSKPTLVIRRKWDSWAQLAGLRTRKHGERIFAPPPPDETLFRRTQARKQAAEERDALIAQARQTATAIAVDGKMPNQRIFDLNRPHNCPLGGELLHRLDLQSWGELAALCGLEYAP